jgi:hypothetical protein
MQRWCQEGPSRNCGPMQECQDHVWTRKLGKSKHYVVSSFQSEQWHKQESWAQAGTPHVSARTSSAEYEMKHEQLRTLSEPGNLEIVESTLRSLIISIWTISELRIKLDNLYRLNPDNQTCCFQLKPSLRKTPFESFILEPLPCTWSDVCFGWSMVDGRWWSNTAFCGKISSTAYTAKQGLLINSIFE